MVASVGAWLLWILAGSASSFVGGYSGPVYRVQEAFDTKTACTEAAKAVDAVWRPECWPLGHDVNLQLRQMWSPTRPTVRE